MRKFRILCIPPYEGMRDLVENIAARRSDIELLVHQGNLEEGLKIAVNQRDNSIDAIISRGCTTEIIRENVSQLTTDIAPSVYDILRVIRTANETGEKFAVVGYTSITKAAKMLRNIIQYDFRVCTIHSQEECLENVSLLKNEGFQLIVGDMMAVQYAREMDMHSLLVTSGMESIESAIDSTVDILARYDSMNQKIDLFSELLKTNDAQDTIIYTSTGKKYFCTNPELPDEINELLERTSAVAIARGKINLIRNRGGYVYNIIGRRVSTKGKDFCVYNIKITEKNEMYDKYSIREVSVDTDINDAYPIEYYLGNSETTASIMDACEKYALIDRPVMILGGRGTGKERLAYTIYSKSRLRQSSMIIIDSGLMDEKGWKYLLENDDSPLNTRGITIYFKRMELIPTIWQQKLVFYFKESGIFKGCRLMFSYSVDSSGEPTDDLYLYLNEKANCLRISIPSLSERKTEIPSLISLYINLINIQHGTQVVGFTQDAMAILQNHSWNRNVYELFQTVQEFVLKSETAHISADTVRNQLSRGKKPVAEASSAYSEFDLDRTLDEIERDIVRAVYESENMNQSQTAKHLGISRSTVWRLLK
ncbi:MAG: PrpR N-terminal domain-containing protein [Eubacteriales bacterium]|nr:PrpR N-terminal domain-containing protein [Eubacteriales bacterium]